MNIFALLNAATMITFGVIILFYVIRNWNNPKKQRYKYSELTYAIFDFILAFYLLFYLNFEGISQNITIIIHMIIFLGNLIILIILLPFNLWKESYKCKKNPTLLENDPVFTRNYDLFLQELNQKYSEVSKKEDFIKDLTRKALHIIMLALLVAFHELSYNLEDKLIMWGLTPLALRNSIYLFIGGVFIFMFSLDDLYRMNYFHCCPNWARSWLSKSLDPRTESWTFISSVPFLQTMLLFIFAPPQVIFGAAVVSCISDSAASIFGKSLGKHKLKNTNPKKSTEGLIAGIISTFFGIIIVFIFYPINGFSAPAILGLAICVSFIFAIIDVWGKYIADNVLNTLIPGLVIYAFILLFQ